MRRFTRSLSCAAMVLFTMALPASGQMVRRSVIVREGGAGGGGMVSLPYVVPDNNGTQWQVYFNGMLQQQGNNPLYSQAAMLVINGVTPTNNQGRNNIAKLDEKTGEVIFENLNANGILVTRRILISKEEGFVRYIDVMKHSQAQDLTVNLQINSNFQFGTSASQSVTDPKGKNQNIGWMGQSPTGRWVVEMYAGKGSKLVPTITHQQGNAQVAAQMQLTLPPNKDVAIVHFHGTANSAEQGSQFILNFKENRLMQSVPKELRKAIVNFTGNSNFIGDMEILRGELFDVVELRGGDKVQGTLREQTFQLDTFYGKVELSPEKIISLINVGQFRPRQLIILGDGQIFGGRLSKETIDLELSSGQVTSIPLSQITRLGYRKRADELEEPVLEKPVVVMRSGDRVAVQMPSEPLAVATRYGQLQLSPDTLSAILFQNDENSVHTIYLTDGSKFAGIANAEQFDMKLEGGTQQVRFPASSIAQLRLQTKVEEKEDNSGGAMMQLANEDLLVGVLTGQLKLDTAFDTLSINAAEIKGLIRPRESGLDVQVTLWDGSTVSGQLQDQVLAMQLRSGVMMKVPVSLVKDYAQPFPQPSTGVIDKIKALVEQFNADDWKERDRAEAQLVAMGSAVTPVIKGMRATQTPEAQQRIDSVLKQLEKTSGPAPAPPAVPGIRDID
jgi:hypothetical protein